MSFNWNFDIFIFLSFLIINLIVGLYHGSKVKTIQQYALGGRNFSTGALVSTIIATWIGGDYLFITLAEVYKTGLHYTVGCLGMVTCLLLNAYVFIPKMKEFLGDISVAESMGKLYGEKIRIITAISGTTASAGFIAVQFKVFGEILNNYVGLSGNYPIFLAASIVVIYSAFGGIRSVTFTDVIQFFTFGVLIPVLGFVVWDSFSHRADLSLSTQLSKPLFNYKEFVGFSNPKFWSLALLFLLFSLPDLNPPTFQRVAMGRNIPQVKKAFAISSVILMLILLGMAWIAFLLYGIDSTLDPASLVQYIIDKYSPNLGLKSFILIGVVAMCMSTADSNINSSSVLLTHDLCEPLGIKFKNELFLSKIIAAALGAIAIYLALLDYDLLPLVFMTQSFYIPIIDVPLVMAILGFRSTVKSVLIGMVAGFIGVIIWRIFFMDITEVDSILPGMVINFIFFVGSHYLLKQKGGWIKVDTTTIKSRNKFSNFLQSVCNFSFMEFCRKNAPKNELSYTSFGIFCLISTLCTMYSMSSVIERQTLLQFYEIMLIVSICFMTYPIWPGTLKNDNVMVVAWNFGTFFLLVICSTFFLLLSNFAHMQFTIFILNILVLALLTRWNIAFILSILGAVLGIKLYRYYTGLMNITILIENSHFIIYNLLFIATAIIIFVRPKQQYQELTEDTNVFLSKKVNDQKKELIKLYELRNEFLRNIEHEAHTPITGIASMGQVLDECYDKLTEKQRRDAIKDIAKSSERLISLVNNLIDVSKLESFNYSLKKSKVNLTGLVHERLNVCKRLYLEPKAEEDLEFSLNIEDNVTALCDKYYIERTIDNMIINAIQYCKKGKISIKLKSGKNNTIEFSIRDEGIGIPKGELYDIFGAFTVSSKTRTPAGGRGVGLALCKKAIEAHHGKIWAESDGTKGSTFKFTIPISEDAN